MLLIGFSKDIPFHASNALLVFFCVEPTLKWLLFRQWQKKIENFALKYNWKYFLLNSVSLTLSLWFSFHFFVLRLFACQFFWIYLISWFRYLIANSSSIQWKILQNEHATNFFFKLKPNFFFCMFVWMCYHLTVRTKVQEINVYIGIWCSLLKVSMLHVIHLTFGMCSNTWFLFRVKMQQNKSFSIWWKIHMYFSATNSFFHSFMCSSLFHFKFLSFRNFILKFWRAKKRILCDMISLKMIWFF